MRIPRFCAVFAVLCFQGIPPAAGQFEEHLVMDGDGRLDVVAGAERGSNEVRWWRNLGNLQE